jgi:hypothetical protein
MFKILRGISVLLLIQDMLFKISRGIMVFLGKNQAIHVA